MKPLNTHKDTCIKQSAQCIVVEDILPFIGNCEKEDLATVLNSIDGYLSQISESLNIEKLDLSCILSSTQCKPVNFEAFLQLLIDKICELKGISNTNQQKIDEICSTLMSCKVTITSCESVQVNDIAIYVPNGNARNSLLHYIFDKLCYLWERITQIDKDIYNINNQIADIWTFINNLSNSVLTFVSYTIPVCERMGVNTPYEITNITAQNNLIIGIYNKVCCIYNTLGTTSSSCAINFAPTCSLTCGTNSYNGITSYTIADALTQVQQFITTACCAINTLDTNVSSLTTQTTNAFNTLAANTACHTNGIGEVFAGDAYMFLFNTVNYQYYVLLNTSYIPAGATITTVNLYYNALGTPSVLTLYNSGPVAGVSDYDSTNKILYFSLYSTTPGYSETRDIYNAYIEVSYTETITYTDFGGTNVNVNCNRKRIFPITLIYQKQGYANISRLINY